MLPSALSPLSSIRGPFHGQAILKHSLLTSLDRKSKHQTQNIFTAIEFIEYCLGPDKSVVAGVVGPGSGVLVVARKGVPGNNIFWEGLGLFTNVFNCD